LEWQTSSVASSPGDTAALAGISCRTTFCLAVGYSNAAGSSGALAELWNGKTWSLLATPQPSGGLFGVSCMRTTLCFGVGTYWHLFDGPDASAATIATTKLKTGPHDIEQVSFTVPAKPGRYYFQCDSHPTIMNGYLVVK